ncbi:hypothetical protein AB0C18_21035 [Nonomuraea muscovyensis]
MSFGFVAFPYPAPEHAEEFAVRELGAVPDGCNEREVKPRQTRRFPSR